MDLPHSSEGGASDTKRSADKGVEFGTDELAQGGTDSGDSGKITARKADQCAWPSPPKDRHYR